MTLTLYSRATLTTLMLLFVLSGCSAPGINLEPFPNDQAMPLIYNPDLCREGTPASVTKIIDGDTIDVEFPDGQQARVRYIGMDTAERGEACFKEATDRNAELLESGEVRLVKDTNDHDRYGRLVRYICTDDNVFVDAQLVTEGYARAFRFYPDVRFADYFQSLEDDAAQNARGCLHRNATENSDASDSACCKMCRNGKACGDSCIPWTQQCHSEAGCACQG
ncbi:MAG TPA: hypothetical protein ENJ84_13510 [Gammaproteobacteria bacterium]|nr:hypothetical protein [Gammaproteobacteria bacterium]